MKINHKHFSSLGSTQLTLLEGLEQDQFSEQHVLISADHQTHGRGRHAKQWNSQHKSLYLSFTLTPNPVLTLTALEIAVLTRNYLNARFNTEISIKWPNDLIYREKKCGGILIQNTKDLLIVGIGVNFKDKNIDISHESFEVPAISIDREIEDAKDCALQLYQYILNKRLTPDETKFLFSKYCAHNKKLCTIQQDTKVYQGQFYALGPMGEAILELSNGKLESIFSGTLRY